MPSTSVKSCLHDNERRSIVSRSRASNNNRIGETKNKKFIKRIKKYAKIIYHIIDCTPPKPPRIECEMNRYIYSFYATLIIALRKYHYSGNHRKKRLRFKVRLYIGWFVTTIIASNIIVAILSFITSNTPSTK